MRKIGEENMRADYIKGIIKKYDEMPYDCILINGTWGIGKTYVVKEALKENDDICYISLFGMRDVQQIFHETFYQLGLKDKKGIRKFVFKILDIVSFFYKKVGIAKNIIESVIKEKELFLELTKTFKKTHVIIVDDLERMNKNLSMEELFGVVDEIKRCNYVKVILIANISEISNKDIFHKYSEKVLDRTYEMTEHTDSIDWEKLHIDHNFIDEFLKMHNVCNLRTLQKAQNLYDDVTLQLKNEFSDEFYNEIRLACYGIVVESTDRLYYRENEECNNDSVSSVAFSWTNRLESRIKNYYLRGVRISENMVSIIQRYYENKAELNQEEVDVEYQIFLHAGDKANFYKTDEEMKLFLSELAENIRKENDIATLVSYVDQYLEWSQCLGLDTEQALVEYEPKLHDLIYSEVLKGKLEYLSAGLYFGVRSEINQKIIGKLIREIENKMIKEYVGYLSEDTHSDLAYDYSYNLRHFMDNKYYVDIISGNIDDLYNENSFPIKNVTKTQYHTAYNIMFVMYKENKEKFLQYCDDIKKNCDHMAVHRINVLLKEITGKDSTV